MKATIRIAALLVIGLVVAAPVESATKVFLLAGQSNMAGLGGYAGNNPSLPPPNPADRPCPSPYDVPQSAVKLWSNLTSGAWVDLQPGYGHKFAETDKTFGPEVTFGYTLHHSLFPSDDIYLIKCSLDRNSLAYDWNPNGTGATYNSFKSIVNTAMADLQGKGLSPSIAGMLWMQGEADAQNAATAAAYKTNLKNLIAKVRGDFNAPEMPFVLGRITTYYDTKPTPGGNAVVRTAQMAIPSEVTHTACINTDDLEWAYIGHYGTQGQIDLGIRFANQFAPVPEPSSFALLGSGMLTLAAWLWRRNGRG
jgi:hypothetical protein